MSKTISETENEKLLITAEIEMRNANGLTRRTFASQEEGEGGEKGEYFDTEKAPSSALLRGTLPPSAFRDATRYLHKAFGPRSFILAVFVCILASIRSGMALRAANTFFNFLLVYLTIILMVLFIMGLMNAMKIDDKVE